MKKIFLLQLLILVAFSACNKNPLCKVRSGNEGIIVGNYPMREDCIYSKKREFLIRSDSQLHSILYVDTIHSVKLCSAVSIPEIDFNQFSLLGLSANTNSGGGFLRTATRNDAEKKILYEVDANTCSYNKVGFSSYNTVLIPKVPDDYTVEFRLKED